MCQEDKSSRLSIEGYWKEAGGLETQLEENSGMKMCIEKMT